MPLNPVMIDNPYGLPPLNGGEEEDPIARLQREYAEEQANPNLQMTRSIAQFAQQNPNADQGALSRALSAAATAVPMSEWKPVPEPLPMRRREHVGSLISFRERQLRALEQFASDPRNPVSRDEVERLRGQIEAETQRALASATLPSPVSFYEALVDQDSPEVAKARLSEGLHTIFGEDWDDSLAPLIDPKASMKDNATSIKSIMDARAGMLKARESKTTEVTDAAVEFEEEQLMRAEPKHTSYEGGAANQQFQKDHAAWESRMSSFFRRTNPEAARLLPTFAEEQGFAPPPGAAPSGAQQQAAPQDEALARLGTATIVSVLEQRGIPSVTVNSADEIRQKVASGDISPNSVIVVNTPEGPGAFLMNPDGTFRVISPFDPKW